jgi:hypothetical protein
VICGNYRGSAGNNRALAEKSSLPDVLCGFAAKALFLNFKLQRDNIVAVS